MTPRNVTIGGVIAGLIVIVLIIFAASTDRQRTAANEWGCSYGDGLIEQKRNLKGEYGPGESGGYSNDKFVTGPSDNRFYYIDKDPATADFGARPIEVPARGSSATGVGVVTVSADVQVRFLINENFCELYAENLKRIEDGGTDLNYNADQGEESGWAQFLNLSMNQKLIEATRPVLRDVDYITLYTNGVIRVTPEDDPATTDVDESGGDPVAGAAYDVLAKQLSANLSRTLRDDLGNDYFCGPSYVFDGTIDGEFEGIGCPPLEVTVKSITPTNGTLIENLLKIVNNEEAEKALVSDTQLANKTAAEQASREVQAQIEAQRAAEQQALSRQAVEIANANADKEIQVNQAAADEAIQVRQATAQQEIQLAEETRRRAVEEAQAATDLAVALARAPVADQLAANRTAGQIADAAFCVELARVGIRCDLLASAEAGSNIVPSINLAGTADGGSAATVVLDARPTP